MTDESNRAVVERYAAALPGDMKTLEELRDRDYVEDWPQSGERIRGHEAYVRVHQDFPGGLPAETMKRVTGASDRWVMSPTYNLLRVVGTGDQYTLEASATYPDGSEWFLVAVVTLKDGRVHRQRTYFAPKLDIPEWRAGLLEPIS